MQNYTVEKIVGEGSFGKALLCRRNTDKRRVIIKQISIAKMSSKEAQRTELEATLLSRLKHPNIVAFIDSFKSSNNLHIVMDYADGGDLETHLKNRRGKLMSEKEVLHMFVQIALAIKHIHDRKILHRDLKSQNIFLTQAGMVKLGDFGVSRVLEKTMDLAATQVGTPYYMPPEIANNTKYNSKCDIWSLGVILFELMTLSMPFKGNSMQQLLRNISNQPVPSVSSSLYCHEIRQMLEAMLCKNQSRRPGINAVLQTPVVLNRIANYLDENVKRQEFSHTVLHGAHILRGRPPSADSPATPSSAAVVNKSPNQAPVVSPLVNLRAVMGMGAYPGPSPPSGGAGPRERERIREREIERERQLKEKDDARKLQRAAEERREKERERERAQAAAIQALRDGQREKEKERERDIERARDRLAAEKRANEIAKQRAAEREREKDRLLEKERAAERSARDREKAAEKEKQRAADLAREKALKQKAAEAELQLKARKERNLKEMREEKMKEDASPRVGRDKESDDRSAHMGPLDHASAAAAALAARRKANLQLFEREREERNKNLRARLKNHLAGGAAMTPSPSVPAIKPTPPKSAEQPKNQIDLNDVNMVQKLLQESDSDSSEERDMRRLGPPPKSSTPSAKPTPSQKSAGLAALEGLGVGQEWLNELEQRMGHLKIQVKQMQANSPKPALNKLEQSPAAQKTPSNVGGAKVGGKISPNVNLAVVGRVVDNSGKKPALPSMGAAPKVGSGQKKKAVPARPDFVSVGNKISTPKTPAYVDPDKRKLREKELEMKEKEDRRREREELREKRRLGLKAFVQAQRGARNSHEESSTGAATPQDEHASSLGSDGGLQQAADEIVPSVFKFIITPPQPQSRPCSAKKPAAPSSRPSSAKKETGPKTPTPRTSSEQREKSREQMKLAMQAARKDSAAKLALNGSGKLDIGIEIYTPRDAPSTLSPRRKGQLSPSPRSPKSNLAVSSPQSSKIHSQKAAYSSPLRSRAPYSDREIEVAMLAEAEAQQYVNESKKKPTIYDLDIEDDDDDASHESENDLDGIAELCDQFDFEDRVGREAEPHSVLEKFNSTLQKIYSASTVTTSTVADDILDIDHPPMDDAVTEADEAFISTSSASQDYHALMQQMKMVLNQTSRILPTGPISGNVEATLGVGVGADELFDDTFGEDEEAYILRGTPSKLSCDTAPDSGVNDSGASSKQSSIDHGQRSSKGIPLSPIPQSTLISIAPAVESVFSATLPLDDDEEAPPKYEIAVSEVAQLDDIEREDSLDTDDEGEFPYDVDDLGMGPILTPGKTAGTHTAYLRDFLTELFGEEKLAVALDLLQGSLSNSPTKGAEEEEDLLLGKLEGVLGTEGLVHLDDMIFLVTNDSNVSVQ